MPENTLGYWQERLAGEGVTGMKRDDGVRREPPGFDGPDGDGFALVEAKDDSRAPWTHGGVPADEAIRGFHSATLQAEGWRRHRRAAEVHGL